MANNPVQNISGPDVCNLCRVILDLHRSGREVPYSRFQPLALELIQEIIPFDSAWWGNAAAEPMEIHQLHLYNCDDSILENYVPYMAQDFFRAELMAHPGVTINMADLTSRARYVRSELYRKVGKLYKIEWSLGTLLLEPVSSLQEFLTLWRHDGKKPFSETERQTKELLMPHLAEAHRVARLRMVLDGAFTRNDRWAVTDEQGYLREASPGFIHCLREYWPDWQGSRLPGALLESIRSATAFNSAKLKIQIVSRGVFRYVQVLALSALTILTPREREIVNRYALGETYARIAAALELSPATVRNHIANCYRKLAINNKAELVGRVLKATKQ
jgi:DNA-binding CsgD family transcriptional regulator